MAVNYDNSLPSPVQGAGTPTITSNRYGDQLVDQLATDVGAERGALFVSRNATLGTGIAQTANTTEDTTKPFIVGFNNASATIGSGSTGGRSIRLVRLFMRPTAVSSSQTIQNISIVTAAGNNYSSAGTDYNIKVSGLNATVGYANIGRADSDAASIMSAFRVGVPVTVLGTAPKLQAKFSPRTTTIPVVGDEYIMYFGQRGTGGGEISLVQPVSTTINRYVKYCDPVIIPPQYSFMVIPWAASIAGAMSWEFELVWMEY